jgi:hypothetical protein
MKKTIRNFLLVFIELIPLSLFNPAANAKNGPGNITESDVSDSTLNIKSISSTYSKENIRQDFSDSINYFIVLKNNKNCMNCFSEINEMIHANKDSLKGRFVVIALIDSTTLERKKSFAENKRLMPDFDDYFFQYKNTKENLLFDKLTTGYTPEIIVIQKAKLIQISYQDIFEFPSLQVSADFQNKISELLK